MLGGSPFPVGNEPVYVGIQLGAMTILMVAVNRGGNYFAEGLALLVRISALDFSFHPDFRIAS